MPRAPSHVEVGWETPDGEPMRVIGYLTPATEAVYYQSNGDPGWPGDPAEFSPVTVVEDKPGGRERPELLDLVEADLDRLTESAEEAAGDDTADRALNAERERTTSGDRGTSTSGYRGTSTSGDRGTSTSGDGGTSTSGDGGILQMRWWDGKRYRLATFYVGEGGIEPNRPYRVDERGRAVKVERTKP